MYGSRNDRLFRETDKNNGAEKDFEIKKMIVYNAK